MTKRFKTIVRKDRRITLPPDFFPGEAVEVIIRVLSPNEPLPQEEVYT